MFLSIILVCSNKRHVSYRLTSPLSIGHNTQLKYAAGYLKYAHIFRPMIYLIDLQIDISLHNNSLAYGDILLLKPVTLSS